MSIRIIRIVYSNDEFKRPVGHETITEGCKLLPYYDDFNRDKRRVVFMPGSNKEQNVGTKWVDGPFRDCWEPQPGFIFKNCELKSIREQTMSMAGPEMLSGNPMDAFSAEPLTGGSNEEEIGAGGHSEHTEQGTNDGFALPPPDEE